MADNQDEPEYVVIKDPQQPEECLELPTNTVDGNLALVTLEHAFPGAYGLKYKNPKTGATRVVSLDDSGKNFVPPPGGWTEKIFEIIFRPATAPQQQDTSKEKPGEQGSRKRKVTEGSEADALNEEQYGGGEEGEDGGQNDGGGYGEEEQTVNGSNQIKSEEKIEGGGGDGATANKETEKGSGSAKKRRSRNSKKQSESSGGGGVDSKRPKPNSKLATKNTPCSDLIVLGLPYTLEKKELREYFEKNFGPLDLCQLKIGPNGVSRGFAFIRTADYYAQVRILSQLDHEIWGRHCQCRLPFRERFRPNDVELLEQMGGRVPRLFIGGLTPGVRKEDLRDYFQKHANRIDKNCDVTDCFMLKTRGFAFISLSSPFVAIELIRQGDFIFEDMELLVTEAAPRESERLAMERGGVGGGGRRSDGNRYSPPPQQRGGGGGGGMTISPWDERALIQQQQQIMAQMRRGGGNGSGGQSSTPYMNPGYTDMSPQYIEPPIKQRHMDYGQPQPVPPPYVYEEDQRLYQQQSSGAGDFMDRGDQGAAPWMDGHGPSRQQQQQMMGGRGEELPTGFTPEMLQVAARWLRQGGGGPM